MKHQIIQGEESHLRNPATVHVTSPARRLSRYRTGKSVQWAKLDALAGVKRGLTCAQGAGAGSATPVGFGNSCDNL